MAGLIGNTSFLGIPIAIALLPTDTINFTIGFDLGTTLFSWIFGPYLLKEKNNNSFFLNLRNLLSSIFNSPASRGIVGVLIIYHFGIDDVLEDLLWIPARFVIYLAIIVVGSRLGIIFNRKKKLFKLKTNLKYSLILKLLILPAFIYVVGRMLNFQGIEVTALVLQAGTPSAISTILLAEAYKKKRDLAAQALLTTTIISSATIPLIFLIIK